MLLLIPLVHIQTGIQTLDRWSFRQIISIEMPFLWLKVASYSENHCISVSALVYEHQLRLGRLCGSLHECVCIHPGEVLFSLLCLTGFAAHLRHLWGNFLDFLPYKGTAPSTKKVREQCSTDVNKTHSFRAHNVRPTKVISIGVLKAPIIF